jgi:hypothetical protein
MFFCAMEGDRVSEEMEMAREMEIGREMEMAREMERGGGCRELETEIADRKETER